MEGKSRGNPGRFPGNPFAKGRVTLSAHSGYYDDTTTASSCHDSCLSNPVGFLSLPPYLLQKSPSLHGEGQQRRRRPSRHSRAREDKNRGIGGRNCRRKERRFRRGRVEEWKKEERNRVEWKDGGKTLSVTPGRFGLDVPGEAGVASSRGRRGVDPLEAAKRHQQIPQQP